MQIRRTYTQMEALDLLHNSEHSSNGIRVCLEGKLVCTGGDSVKEESLSEHLNFTADRMRASICL
jgi:hypothetical protein